MKRLDMLLRRALFGVAVGLALCAAPPAGAADYPSRPVKIIVPFPPGGTIDVQARAIAAQLSEVLKQSFIVETHPGAGGTIGAAFVAKSPPDGYTLLLTLRSIAISPAVVANLPFDPAKDFEPITQVEATYWILCTSMSLPVTTFKEAMALSKTRPGGLNYAGTGIGGDNHLTWEQIQRVTGVKFTQVPYNGGGPALVALMGGQVDIMLVPGAIAVPQIKAGKIRPIAVLGGVRAPSFPDVPTLTEAGLPGFEGGSWTGLFAPKGTPESIVRLLNTEVRKIVDRNRETGTMFVPGLQVPEGSTPEALGAMMREDVVKWGQLARELGLKPE
jgi:tripartite-type tricarboxylate transporter receptor subunit TctC